MSESPSPSTVPQQISLDQSDFVIDFLVHHRRILLCCFLIIQLAFLLPICFFPFEIVIDMGHVMFSVLKGDGEPFSNFTALESSLWGYNFYENLTLIGLYIVAQVLCLWGCGSVRISRGRLKKTRVSLTLFLLSAIMSVLTIIFFVLFQALIGNNSIEVLSPVGEVFGNDDFTIGFLVLLLSSWLFWLLIAVWYYRKSESHQALSRMIGVLLAGSWIEFSLALPIDIVSRPKQEDCPCAFSSWWALLFLVPIIMWMIGPALYLLYLREKSLSYSFPLRAKRVLAKKTVRESP